MFTVDDGRGSTNNPRMVETKDARLRFYINLGYLRPLFDHLSAFNTDLAPYLERLGVTEEELAIADLRVPAEAINELLERAERELNDANVGLHAGQRTQLQHMGIMGLLIMNCRVAREVFELHARYQTLVGNSLDTRYQTDGERCYLESHMTPGHVPFSRHSIDFVFGGWWSLKQSMVGTRHAPQLIEFPYAKPRDVSELSAFFAAPMSFGHDALRVYFDREHMELELMPADSELKQVIEMQAQQRLNQLQGCAQTDADPYLASIKQIIAKRMAYGVPSIESVAHELNMSARTLQRQLEHKGARYSELLDGVRQDLAGRYVQQKNMSLLDVAMMLGFSEQSGFQRAFKRWFRTTPGEYRRNQ